MGDRLRNSVSDAARRCDGVEYNFGAELLFFQQLAAAAKLAVDEAIPIERTDFAAGERVPDQRADRGQCEPPGRGTLEQYDEQSDRSHGQQYPAQALELHACHH